MTLVLDLKSRKKTQSKTHIKMFHEVKIYFLCVCLVILNIEKNQFEKTHKMIP